MEKRILWTRNFRILISASVLGTAGAIAGSYALRFLVYEQTGSTLAAGILTALAVVPQFFLPVLIAPIMDRLPRKPFLVAGDLISGILYLGAGWYLLEYSFSYTGYLLFSLFLAAIGAVDSLAYNSIFPSVIPKGMEHRGYTIAGMLYPVMNVIIMPIAGFLIQYISVAEILMLQGVASIGAGMLESLIKIKEINLNQDRNLSFKLWFSDFKDGFAYISKEKGLQCIYGYMAFTNGVAAGQLPILVAHFSTAPGLTAAMYGFFAFAEFTGRSIAGFVRCHITIPKEKRFPFVMVVYLVYEWMDAILLWLPFPWMLMNRGICGFLGFNSATERTISVQSYIPEDMRARVNAFETAVVSAAASVMAIIVGWIGEVFQPKATMSITAMICLVVCLMTVWKSRTDVARIYEMHS